MGASKVTWTTDSISVLAAFATAPTSRHHGYALAETTGVRTRLVYGLLYRFEARGWLTSERERIVASLSERPPRRLYRVTDAGIEQYRRLCRALGIRRRVNGTRSLPIRPTPVWIGMPPQPQRAMSAFAPST